MSFREWFALQFPIDPDSAETGEGLDSLLGATYHLLEVTRVDTKVPDGSADRTKPFTRPVGSAALDLAREKNQPEGARGNLRWERP